MPKGTIKLISDRGFGFIRTAEGKELFFHRNELQGVDYSSLREGQQVEFEVGQGAMVVPRQSASSLISLRANSPTRWAQCRSINILIP